SRSPRPPTRTAVRGSRSVRTGSSLRGNLSPGPRYDPGVETEYAREREVITALMREVRSLDSETRSALARALERGDAQLAGGAWGSERSAPRRPTWWQRRHASPSPSADEFAVRELPRRGRAAALSGRQRTARAGRAGTARAARGAGDDHRPRHGVPVRPAVR